MLCTDIISLIFSFINPFKNFNLLINRCQLLTNVNFDFQTYFNYIDQNDIEIWSVPNFIIKNNMDFVGFNGLHHHPNDKYICFIIKNIIDVYKRFILNKDNFIITIFFNSYKNIMVLKMIETQFKINKQDFHTYENFMLSRVCTYGHYKVLKYLCKQFNFDKEYVQSHDNEALRYACERGHIEIVKFLHKKFKLEKRDAQSNENYALRWACRNGHIWIVEYLHKKFKLEKQDAQSYNTLTHNTRLDHQLCGNYALKWACEKGHFDIVKYLHKKFKLGRQDAFHSGYPSAYKIACTKNKNEIAGYLRNEFK